MSEIQINLKEKLTSDNIDEIRQAAEEYMYTDQDDEAVKLLAGLIEYPDKGVRNAAAMAIKFGPNQKLAAKYLAPLIASQDISVRNLAGDILVNCGSEAIEALDEFLTQTDDDGIKFIVDLFSLIKDPSVTNSILQTLRTKTDENVILACVEALGHFQCEEAIEDLITTYWMNEFYRPTVVEALGRIGGPKSLEFLMSIYEEADELTKFSIVEGLGIIGDTQTFFFLISQINENHQAITWPLVDAICKLKNQLGFDVPFDESMKNAIVETIESADLDYKYSALDLIQDFGDKNILNACLKAYGKDPAFDMDLNARLMANMETVIPILIKCIAKPEYNSKGLLNLLLEYIKSDTDTELNLDPVALRTLCDDITKELEDPDEEVRKAAMELLFIIQPETALLFVDTMTEDTNMWNKIQLIEILQSRSEPEALNALKVLSEDPEEMVSFQAKEALQNNENNN